MVTTSMGLISEQMCVNPTTSLNSTDTSWNIWKKKKTLTHSGFKGLIAQSFDNAQVLHIWRYILMLTEGFLKNSKWVMATGKG